MKGRWNVPPRNPFFTGREDILDALQKLLPQGATQLAQPPAISGLGGIGKTQTAIEYAHRHRHEYQAVLWVNAETETEIIASFAAIARLLDLPEKDEAEQSRAITAVQGWLSDEENWLLIFDNADDLALANKFVPSDISGHIIYTTRAAATGKLARRIQVLKFSHEEGARLLLKRAKRDDSSDSPEWNDALAFSDKVDGLPLALDQAGAYMEENNLSANQYLRLYEKEGVRLLEEYGSLGDEDHAPVAVTFSLAFKQVAEQHPAAADLLNLCSFFGPDNIPEELFTGNTKLLAGELSMVASDAKRWAHFIGLVCHRSLMSRNAEDHSLSIHRVVQAVLREEMNEERREAGLKHAINLLHAVFPKAEYTDWPLCESLLSHVFTCLTHSDTCPVPIQNVSIMANQVGIYLYSRGQYIYAEPLIKLALETHEVQLGVQHPDTAISLNNLASLYQLQGKLQDAEPLYQRALQIREKQLGAEHPDTANSLNNLASLYQLQGKLQDAEPLYQRALQIREKQLGAEHPDTANSLNNLAGLYKDRGKLQDAEPLCKRALQIREKQLGAEHPDTAISLNNLAGLYKDQGKLQDAEPLYQRALQICEKQLGTEHTTSIIVRGNLECLTQLMLSK